MSPNHDEEICAAIEAVRDRLVDAVLANMYPNPFWDDRYGARGRALCQEDNHHHLNYLIAAIRTHSPDSMAAYYKWLQILLVSRGMCTYHIRQNMERMEDHLRALLPAAWPAIKPYHQAGYAGLAYAQPACQALAAHAAQIAEATTAQMYATNPFWEQQFGPRGRALCREDNLYHLAYLQDAVGVNAPDRFGSYLDWLTGFLGRRGLAADHLHADLQILADELARALPVVHAQPFLTLLAAQTQPI
ncbi:MAG: hypothetical protein M3R61_20255 [Chloroflexota bacterium]|nr:hypothetical protein [Chloroflexota bacterium]